VLATWPHSYPTDQLWDFTLSGSGTVVGQVTLAGSSTFIHSATLLNGTPVWTQTAGKYIPIRISPDGSRIALSDNNPPPVMSATTTNTYINGTLSGAATGFALGWVDDNRLLVSQYEFRNHSTNLVYAATNVVNASGQLITASLPIPELTEMQVLPANLIYSPERNEIYDLTTAQRTWSSQAPHSQYTAGAVAGSNVIFTSKATLRIEPR
jgi:hypothetical protein